MTNEGRLEAIWIKRAKRGPMDPVDEASLEEEVGIPGNANRARRRQVTVIEREAWEAMMAELGVDADPSLRRANLMVSGVRLRESRGKILTIGQAGIRIEGETIPCQRMDEALPGLRKVMEPEWRGGVYGMVVSPGRITPGDPVRLQEAAERPGE